MFHFRQRLVAWITKLAKPPWLPEQAHFPLLYPVNRWVSHRLHFLISDTRALPEEDKEGGWPGMDQKIPQNPSTWTAHAWGQRHPAVLPGWEGRSPWQQAQDCPQQFLLPSQRAWAIQDALERTPWAESCPLEVSWKPPSTETPLYAHVSPNKSKCLSLETQ